MSASAVSGGGFSQKRVRTLGVKVGESKRGLASDLLTNSPTLGRPEEFREYGNSDFGDNSYWGGPAASRRHVFGCHRRLHWMGFRPKTRSEIRGPWLACRGRPFRGDLPTYRPISSRPAHWRFVRKIWDLVDGPQGGARSFVAPRFSTSLSAVYGGGSTKNRVRNSGAPAGRLGPRNSDF